MHPMLTIAVKAARRAGSIISHASQDVGALKIRSKTYNDFVSEVDHAAERAIIDTLKDAYPTHGFLGEDYRSARWHYQLSAQLPAILRFHRPDAKGSTHPGCGL
jgi:fructose-1,6-bisphosphatase/inositol monophosphatase family enzyme